MYDALTIDERSLVFDAVDKAYFVLSTVLHDAALRGAINLDSPLYKELDEEADNLFAMLMAIGGVK